MLKKLERHFLLCVFSLFSWWDWAADASSRLRPPPNVIFILADDLGWNDIGFHGSVQIPTPNIDALAYSGVILNNYYVQPICTPSRSAIMSAMHPIHTGLQHGVILGANPYGLPLNHKLLPQYLNDLGYVSRHIGKWHLGLFKKEYTPLYRGFKSHYGYWSGRIDYYSRTATEPPGWTGYDFRRDMNTDYTEFGEYATDVFTREGVKVIQSHNQSKPLFLYLAHLAVHSGNPQNPLQAPYDVVKRFKYIKDENRRKFAAMVSKLDESVGLIVKALETAKMLKNSIIVFSTDNGGPAAGFNANAASNWPFRGVKASVWEGGVRGASFIWSPLLKSPGRVSLDMMSVMDWLPTLYTACDGNVSTLPKMDGMNMWETLRTGERSKRIQILHNIDPISKQAALRIGDWKLLTNPTGEYGNWDDWYGPSGRQNVSKKHEVFHEKTKDFHNFKEKSNLFYEKTGDYFNFSQRNDIFHEQTGDFDQKSNFYMRLMGLETVEKSMAFKSIEKVISQPLKNAFSLLKSAEVLCGPVPKNATQKCNEKYCLFNIRSDPCEYFDVSAKYPKKVKALKIILEQYGKSSVPPLNPHWDPNANPVYWNYTWTNWQDFV